jgi:hypothetical protein
LLVVLDIRVSVVEDLSQFSDLSLQACPFVLEPDGHLSDLSVDHGLSLAFHHGPQVFEFLGLALLSSLIPVLPFLNFLKKVLVLLLLRLVFLLQ